MARLSLILLSMILTLMVSAFPAIANSPVLIKEVHVARGGIEDVNGTLFFSAGVTFPELWKSDGTSEGTMLVKEFTGYYESPSCLTNLNGVLLFTLDRNTLWKSDGTEPGTVLIKDFSDSSLTCRSSSGSSPLKLKTATELIFFITAGYMQSDKLWRSDGTSSGTFPVKDLYTAPNPLARALSDNFGGFIYFNDYDGVHGNELWKSDGTAAGTTLIDICPGARGSGAHDFVVFNAALYFLGGDCVAGNGLWTTDGTAQGTHLVKNSSSGFGNGDLTKAGPLLYFTADSIFALWKSDGSTEGTVKVKDFSGLFTNNENLNVILIPGEYNFAYVKETGNVFFKTFTDNTGYELWKSDGTPEGTALVKDYIPRPGRVISS